jgi:hypothetical protein
MTKVAMHASAEAIFRVKAAASDHWVVFRDADAEPIAAFGDKASALAYALHLARRRRDSDQATAHPRPHLEAGAARAERRAPRRAVLTSQI